MKHKIIWISGAAVCLFLTLLLIRFEPWANTPTDGKHRISGARKALQFISAARAYPGATIPDFGIAPAFEAAKVRRLRDRSLTASSAELESWRAIGPTNIGGRTLALAVNPQDPQTIYAGSASGGLWRSRTAGSGPNAWEYVSTGHPVLGVSSIAIARDDSNKMFIGTGEVYGSPESHPGITAQRLTRGSYGIGVLKSDDGGQTWSKSLDWAFNQQRGVQMVRINPMDSETVWAATTLGTHKSIDGGSSWRLVHDVVMATDIAINPQDTSVVFVACGGMASPGHGIYRSRDGGATWQQMAIPGVTTFYGKARLSMSQSSPNVVFASIGFSEGKVFGSVGQGSWLARTTDGGDSWRVTSNLDYSRIQGWYAHDVAVHPTNPDIVWAAGQPGNPVYSDDGGFNLRFVDRTTLYRPDPETSKSNLPTTWADFHSIVFDPTNPDVIYFTNDGGVFRSADGGRTVKNCSRGLQTTQFYNGTSSSDTDSLMTLGGLQDNNSAMYIGSSEWRRLFGGDGSWTAIDQSDNNTIYVSLQWLTMGKSTVRGLSGFLDISPPDVLETTTNFIAPFVLSPVDNQVLFAGSNRVHISHDGGSSWSRSAPLDSNPLIAMAASPLDVDVVYAATSPGESRGRIFKTTTHGEQWLDITADLPDRFPTDLYIHPDDDQIVYLALGGFGTSHLYRTEDGGASWQDVGAGLPDVPHWSVAVDPDHPQQIFVGNDLGVWFSEDEGLSWQQHEVGLPDAIMAMDLTISRSNRMLRVATHGNGFYESRLPDPLATSVAATEPALPDRIELAPNFPNPFNLETRLKYFLEQGGQVELVVFNAVGREVRRVFSGTQAPGWHEVIWDGKDANGQVVATGVYFSRLQAAGRMVSRKMLALK